MATHSSILPGKFHGQRSWADYSPWGRKRAGQDFATKQQQEQTLKQTSPLLDSD